MAGVSDPTPTGFAGLDASPARSGKVFVIGTAVFLTVFLILILTLGRNFQDAAGLNARGFDVPTAPVTAVLTLDGVEVGTATWDAEGVCAEITDATGTTFRTCAVPDPLRPIWAIDAPDDADPGYILVATPAVASIGGLTTAGEGLNALTQGRELPAAWAVIPLPPGAVVAELVAYNTESSDLGNALCGDEEAPTDGPARLGGGCLVPQQD